jgi:hypothetical protein
MAFNRFEDYGEGLGLKFLQDLEIAYQYIGRHPRIGRLYANNRILQLVDQFLANLVRFGRERFNGRGNVQAKDEGAEFVGRECA